MSFLSKRSKKIKAAATGASVLSRRFLEIRVKSITGRWHTLKCKKSDTIGSIKAQIRAQEGPSDYKGKGLMFVHDAPEWQNVVFKKEVLRDLQSIASAGVTNNAQLLVTRKRRLVPQARESGGCCLEDPCVHKDGDHQYGPDMHWSNAYGYEFPGKRDFDTGRLIDPEFELKIPKGGLKAQRLRTGPQNHRGDVALQMESEKDIELKRAAELDGDLNDFADEGENMEMSDLDEEAELIDEEELEASCVVEPDEANSKQRVRKAEEGWCARTGSRYCYEVKLGFQHLVAGWMAVFIKPSESSFEPSEELEDALEASIDPSTCLNLSYQDLGHAYQWQYFVKLVPHFQQLLDLNMSHNSLHELPEFEMPQLRVLSLAYNLFDDLENVPSMPELRVLDLTANNLDTAAGVYKFQRLERLTLLDNPIEYKDMYDERVKARAPASLCWLDGKPFEPSSFNLQYLLKLMFQSQADDAF